MKKFMLVGASCLAITFATSEANAQSIDYGVMQEMFGEPVTTSATGKPQRMSEVPVTMEILTADDIRRSGAVDLPEVLRQVNGVNVLQTGEQTYDVSVRGYNQYFSQRLLVLVNGRQVYLDHYGMTAWSTIPVQLSEIRQIEIVKGPNTALFGFNAVSGVINIVTYNPLYDDQSSAGVTVGTQDFRQGHYVQSFKASDKLGVRVSAGKRDSNGFNNSATNGIAATTNAITTDTLFVDPEQESINVDTMYQLTDKSQLRFEASATNAHQTDVTAVSLFATEFETKSAKLGYEIDSEYGLIKATLYKNFLEWDTDSPTSPAGYQKMDNEVLVAQLENTVQLNNEHTIRVQGEYRKNEMTSEYILDPAAEVSYEVFALGGMWNWVVNDQWSWTNALRVDHLMLDHNGQFTAGNPFTANDFDRDITEFSYNSGLVWRPTETDTVRFSTARGLEIPSLLEFGLDAVLPPLTAVGNPDLDPAVVTNYEIAWDRKVDFIEDGLFRSAIFYQDTQDVKTVQSGLNGLVYESDNIGDSNSFGVELALDGKVDQKWDWGLGYIYQIIEDDLANGVTPAALSAPKDYEEGNPQHQVKAKLGYKDGPWEADTLVYYVSQTKQIGDTFSLNEVDGYVGVNARVGYTFDNDVTLAVSGMNVQEADTQTAATPDIERRVFVSLSKKF